MNGLMWRSPITVKRSNFILIEDSTVIKAKGLIKSQAGWRVQLGGGFNLVESRMGVVRGTFKVLLMRLRFPIMPRLKIKS